MQSLNCTADDLVAMLNQSIAIDYFPDPLNDELDLPTDVGSVSAFCRREALVD